MKSNDSGPEKATDRTALYIELPGDMAATDFKQLLAGRVSDLESLYVERTTVRTDRGDGIETDGGVDAAREEDAIIHDEIEVSKHLIVSQYGVDKHGVEWEVHTGFDDPYYVEEDTARRVKQNLGLDLENGRYQSGGDVIVVGDEEADGQ